MGSTSLPGWGKVKVTSSSLWMKSVAALYIALTVLAGSAAAQSDLHAVRRQMKDALRNTPFGIPLVIESVRDEGFAQGTAYGELDHPFSTFALFTDPQVWCDTAFLHLNVKACVHEKTDDTEIITLYSGRKFYQSPEKTQTLNYAFKVKNASDDHLKVELTAPEGPLGTGDYRILLEAVPLSPEQTFLAFSYSYRFGLRAKMAVNAYLSTLGRNKEGFTLVRENGESQYVQGFRGIVERNAVRYYYAIEAYLDTLDIDEARTQKRLERWFELTSRHSQLDELKRQEYLANKMRELKNQQELQQRIDSAN